MKIKTTSYTIDDLRKDVKDAVSTRYPIPQYIADEAVLQCIALIRQALVAGKRVRLDNIGTINHGIRIKRVPNCFKS